MKVIEAIEIQQIISTINNHNKLLSEDMVSACAGALTPASPVDLLAKKSMDPEGKQSIVNYVKNKKISGGAKDADAKTCISDAQSLVARKIESLTDVALLNKLKSLSIDLKFRDLINKRLDTLAKLAKATK